MKSKRAERMIFTLRLNVGKVRRLWRVEGAKVNVLSIDPNGRLPLPRAKLFHAQQPAGVTNSRLTLVLAVLRRACVSQVRNPVVVGDAVDMVDITFGPLTVHIKPSEPVFCVPLADHPDTAVAALDVFPPCPVSRLNFGRLGQQPRKYSSFWFVVEQGAKKLCGKIGSSHDALLKLIGQRPGSASTLAGLRHFNAMGAI